MNTFLRRCMAVGLLALLLPAVALAQQAFARNTLNLRAGPSTDYPVVAQLGPGQPFEVYGCVDGYAWCDVVLPDGLRGWVWAQGIDYAYADRRVPLATYGAAIGVPIVSFVITDYWGQLYRDRPWYGESRWWRGHRPPPPTAGWRPAPPPRPQWRPRPLPRPGPGVVPSRPGYPGPGVRPHPGQRPSDIRPPPDRGVRPPLPPGRDVRPQRPPRGPQGQPAPPMRPPQARPPSGVRPGADGTRPPQAGPPGSRPGAGAAVPGQGRATIRPDPAQPRGRGGRPDPGSQP